MHTPVLLKVVIEALDVKPNGLYIDATFGEGGHSGEIIKKGGKVLGIEADKGQIDRHSGERSDSRIVVDNDSGPNFAKASLGEQAGMTLKLIHRNFKDIEKIARKNNFFPVDGILFDLGLSMRQINESKKGFSYRKLEEPLDMRLDTNQELTAEKIINNYSQEELYEIFTKNSEELNSWNIAQAIVGARRLTPLRPKNSGLRRGEDKIKTVGDFINVINKACFGDQRIYSRIFQALRIEVNSEFENLKKGLEGSLKLLKKNGRIVIITFHSLEDRIVKKFVRENKLRQLNKKVIKGDREIRFERSAKIRIIVNS